MIDDETRPKRGTEDAESAGREGSRQQLSTEELESVAAGAPKICESILTGKVHDKVE